MAADANPLRDAEATGEMANEERLAEQYVESVERSDGAAGVELPQINVSDRHLRVNTMDALGTLRDANNPPVIFVRAGELVRIVPDEKGIPSISPVTEAALRGRMERTANYLRNYLTLRGRVRAHPISPPIEVVKDVIGLGQWPCFPALQAITETPVITPTGRALTEAGYDAETNLYYAPDATFTLPPIPDAPTPEQVAAASAQLQELIQDFPFVDEAARANALAALLTSIVRPFITGLIPMALIDKPQAGTGASLLAEVISLLATGRAAAMMSQPKDDEEMRKKITSFLLAGRSLVIMDNVETKLYAPSLAAALTSTRWQDRHLGKSEQVDLPHQIAWIATGNNIQLGGDLPRRCYWIRLDAKIARPWQRTGFRHPNLPEWVKQNRGSLVGAALTIAKGWISAGRPAPDNLPVIGGFDEWARTLGGILAYAGVGGFLANLDTMYDQMDVETPQWESFLQTWHSIWGKTPVTTARVVDHIKASQASENGDGSVWAGLPDAVADALETKKSVTRVLGRALSARNGMRFPCGLRVARGPVDHQAVTWRVSSEDERETTRQAKLEDSHPHPVPDPMLTEPSQRLADPRAPPMVCDLQSPDTAETNSPNSPNSPNTQPSPEGVTRGVGDFNSPPFPIGKWQKGELGEFGTTPDPEATVAYGYGVKQTPETPQTPLPGVSGVSPVSPVSGTQPPAGQPPARQPSDAAAADGRFCGGCLRKDIRDSWKPAQAIDLAALAERHDGMLIQDYLNGWLRDGDLREEHGKLVIVAGKALDRSVRGSRSDEPQGS